MSLEDALRLVQILFYVLTGTLAVLTYRNAIRGLLNPVNTEYQKRVMDRLKELADELADEFDPNSPNYWAKQHYYMEAVDRINETFTNHKDTIVQSRTWPFGVPLTEDYQRLDNLVRTIKSDPFIPHNIRELVVELLEQRCAIIGQVTYSELQSYQLALVSGSATDPLDRYEAEVHNNIISELNRRGCSMSDIEGEVDKIRYAIQNYFESFNPLR
jgi:hypothetical protein